MISRVPLPRWPALAGLVLTAHVAWDAGRYPRAAAIALLTVALAPILLRLGSPAARGLRGPVSLLVLVAIPVACWASPQFWTLSWEPTARLLWAVGLAVLIATWRDPDAPPGSGPPDVAPWTFAYLAVGVVAAASFGRAPANEVAGVLAPFPVLAGALAMAPASDPRWARWRPHLALVGLATAITIYRLGSRGGLLAATVGLAVAVVATGVHRRPWMTRPRAVALVFVLVAATWLAAPRWTAYLLFDGSPQGFSWRVALHGRPDIWDRALAIVGDAGVTGIGLGTFGTVVARIYPLRLSGGPLEDAHSLALQTVLDFGLPGTVAMAWLGVALVLALRDLRRSGDDGGPLAAGLLGALVASVAFGVMDSVAWGTMGNVVAWMLVGLIFGHRPAAVTRLPENEPRLRVLRRGTVVATRLRPVPTDAGPEPAPEQAARPARVVLVVMASVSALLAVPAVRDRLALDLAARDAYRALLGPRAALPPVHETLAPIAGRVCRARWLEGRVLETLDDARRDAAYEDLIGCGGAWVDRIAVVAPGDTRLAQVATRLHPELASAHGWRARASMAAPARDRETALHHFRRALTLASGDGRTWLAYGDALVEDDIPAAFEAYGEACRHGDPGANACVRAGETALLLGDRAAAIAWLRRSRWPPARVRADALENDPAARR